MVLKWQGHWERGSAETLFMSPDTELPKSVVHVGDGLEIAGQSVVIHGRETAHLLLVSL